MWFSLCVIVRIKFDMANNKTVPLQSNIIVTKSPPQHKLTSGCCGFKVECLLCFNYQYRNSTCLLCFNYQYRNSTYFCNTIIDTTIRFQQYNYIYIYVFNFY